MESWRQIGGRHDPHRDGGSHRGRGADRRAGVQRGIRSRSRLLLLRNHKPQWNRGVRSEAVTILPAMAAAIGAGVPIDEPAFNGVFVLDRDCCSFAIISLNGIVASFDLPGGVDLLIEDFAIHALATRGIALEPNSIHEAFRARGIAGSEILGWEAWAGELETGRSAVAAASNGDFLRSSAPFA